VPIRAHVSDESIDLAGGQLALTSGQGTEIPRCRLSDAHHLDF
jgi:hypothetical protein